MKKFFPKYVRHIHSYFSTVGTIKLFRILFSSRIVECWMFPLCSAIGKMEFVNSYSPNIVRLNFELHWIAFCFQLFISLHLFRFIFGKKIFYNANETFYHFIFPAKFWRNVQWFSFRWLFGLVSIYWRKEKNNRKNWRKEVKKSIPNVARANKEMIFNFLYRT